VHADEAIEQAMDYRPGGGWAPAADGLAQ